MRPLKQLFLEKVRTDDPSMLDRTRPNDQQHALHVTDYYCAMTLAQLRAMGACGRKAERKLTEYEFDTNQFNRENGDGEIY